MPFSPYIGIGTDGLDLGVHYVNWKRETDIARSGDRRGATRTLWTGTEGSCLAAYPTTYNNDAFVTPPGPNRFVTAGSALSLQTQINAAAASGQGGIVVIPNAVANRISTSTVSLPAVVNGSTTPGGNIIVMLMSKAMFDSIDIFTGKPTVLPEGVAVVSAAQAARFPTMTATDPELFAHIQGAGLSTAAAVFDTGTAVSNGYCYAGLYVTGDPTHTTTTPTTRLFRIGTGNGTQNSDALTPKNHVWRSCIVGPGHPSQQILHGIDCHARGAMVIDSDVPGIWEAGNGDCQAFIAYNTNGDITLLNSSFEASDECIGWGGGTNHTGSMRNCESRWCRFWKRDSWNINHPSYDNTQGRPAYNAGTTYAFNQRVSSGNLSYRTTQNTAWSSITTYSAGTRVSYSGANYIAAQSANLNHLPTDATWWTAVAANVGQSLADANFWIVDTTVSVKLVTEVKAGGQILYAGCISMYCHAAGQNGDGINIKKNYTEAGGLPTRDIIIRDGLFQYLGTGVRIAGNADDSGSPLMAVQRVALLNLVGLDIGGGYYDPGNSFGEWMRSGGVEGLSVDHCTAFPTRCIHLVLNAGAGSDGSNGLTNAYTHRNSVYGGPTSYAYFRGPSTGDGKQSIDTYAPSAVLEKVVITGGNLVNYVGSNLIDLYFPASIPAIVFSDYLTGDVSLSGTTQIVLPTVRGPLMSRMSIMFGR